MAFRTKKQKTFRWGGLFPIDRGGLISIMLLSSAKYRHRLCESHCAARVKPVMMIVLLLHDAPPEKLLPAISRD